MTNRTRKTLLCPICKQQSKVPTGGVSEFQKSFYISQIRALKSEKITYPPFPIHRKEDLRFFCRVCRETFCRDCKVIAHGGHTAAYVSDIVLEMQIDIQQKTEDMIVKRNQLSNLKQFILDEYCSKEVEISSEISKIEAQADKMKSEIDKIAAKFKDQLINQKCIVQHHFNGNSEEVSRQLTLIEDHISTVKYFQENYTSYDLLQALEGYMKTSQLILSQETIHTVFNYTDSLNALYQFCHNALVSQIAAVELVLPEGHSNQGLLSVQQYLEKKLDNSKLKEYRSKEVQSNRIPKQLRILRQAESIGHKKHRHIKYK